MFKCTNVHSRIRTSSYTNTIIWSQIILIATSLNLQRTNLHVHTSLNCAKFDDSIAPIPCVPVHQYHIYTSLIREPNNHVSINLASHVRVNLEFNLNLFEFHIINTHNLTHKCYHTLLVTNTQWCLSFITPHAKYLVFSQSLMLKLLVSRSTTHARILGALIGTLMGAAQEPYIFGDSRVTFFSWMLKFSFSVSSQMPLSQWDS